MTNLNQMFTAATATTNAGSRSLAGTVQLTEQATGITSNIIAVINEKQQEYADLFLKSQTDHNAMDQLINGIEQLDMYNIEYLKACSDTELDSMLKSQQSKRSRTKSKTMTFENYKTMMVAGVAENLLRLAMGKAKSATTRVAGSSTYTAEEIAALTVDSTKLAKEIRNVQSKKSILKSKVGFSADSPQWQALLDAEATLKALRDGVTTTTVVVDTTKDALTELFVNINIESMNAKQCKELLAKIVALTIDEVQEESTSLVYNEPQAL